MKAKRRINIWLWVLLCIPCLLASCDYDVHSDEEESGLSVSLTWADEADQGTEVKDVKLWIFNANDGSLVEEKQYGGVVEVSAKQLLI
jgi:hypothetical protein